MAFATKQLDKWVKQQVDIFQQKSDQYGFETTHAGVDFEDHPFKIKMTSCNAPVLNGKKTTLDSLVKADFTMELSLSNGYIYDLAKYKPNIKVPLYISKRKDGRYVCIDDRSKTFLTDDELRVMRVPVAGLNAVSIPISTTGGFLDYNGLNGCLFLYAEFEDLKKIDSGQAAKISKAGVLNAAQLQAKFPGITVFDGVVTMPYDFQGKARVIQIYSAENSAFVCLNSPYLKLASSVTFSDLLKRVLEEQRTDGNFYFSFQPRPYDNVLRNDLFLRIN